jgi:transcriptional regulator with XRE-family HTH domain
LLRYLRWLRYLRVSALLRLEQAIVARGKTKSAVAKSVGLSSGYMTWLFSNPTHEPRRATLELFAEELKVPKVWLLLGEGELPDFLQEEPAPKRRKVAR